MRLTEFTTRGGIRSQQLQERRALRAARPARRPPARRPMAVEVDEEQVLPQAGARRPRFEPRHADAVPGERLEQRVHGARAVLRRHHQRRFVAPGRRDAVPAEHPEARRVVRLVLDVRREHVEAVDRRRGLAGDRRDAGLAQPPCAPPRRCSPPGCAAPRADGARATARTAKAIARASRSSRRPRRARHPSTSRCWTMRSLISPTIVSWRLAHEVERAPDRALGGVLDRHHRVVGLARLRPRETLRRSTRTARPRRSRRNACSPRHG